MPIVVSVEEAARIASALPEVTEGERYGHRTWQVAGKAFAWDRPFSKADIERFGDTAVPDGPILAVRVADLDDKKGVLAAETTGVFTIPHFDNYAAVLIHLKRASKRTVHDAIVDAWLACAPTKLANDYIAQESPRRR